MQLLNSANLSFSFSIAVRFFIISISYFALMSVAFGATPTTTDTLIDYQISETCEAVVYFPYDLGTDWQDVWTTQSAEIRQYGGVHPSTVSSEGLKSGYTNDTIGDWLVAWQNASTTTVSGNTVHWENVQHSTGDFYWFWYFPDGNQYYAQFSKNADGTCAAADTTIGIDVTQGFNSTTNTRFTDLTFSSTTITAEYFLDENEVNTTISELNPTLVRFSYALRPSTTMTRIGESIDPETFGTSTVSTNVSILSLADGTYDLLVDFSNQGVPFGSPEPFPDSYIYTDFTIASGSITATGTLEFYDSTTFLENTLIYNDCGLTSIDGCLKNVLIWLFYPSWSIEYFGLVKDELETKIPFNYVFQIQDQIDNLSNGTGTIPTLNINFGIFDNFELMNSSFMTTAPMSTVFSTIRTLSVVVIYGTLVVVLYRRGRRFINSLTSST